MGIEIGQILLERDFRMNVEYLNNLGNTLSRAELEDICLQTIGQEVPNNSCKFRVKSLDNKYFVVEYVKPWDKFLWKKFGSR